MLRMFSSILFAGALMFGCMPEQTTSQGGLIQTQPGCVKIEDSQIGQLFSFTLGGVLVTITDWVEKAGEPGEYVGFTVDTPVCYTVKSGGDVSVGEDTTFINPYGTSGPSAHGISNIEFCPCDEKPPECEKKDEKGECIY